VVDVADKIDGFLHLPEEPGVSSSLPYADYMKARFADISESLESMKAA
jgi:hypothetical protein